MERIDKFLEQISNEINNFIAEYIMVEVIDVSYKTEIRFNHFNTMELVNLNIPKMNKSYLMIISNYVKEERKKLKLKMDECEHLSNLLNLYLIFLSYRYSEFGNIIIHIDDLSLKKFKDLLHELGFFMFTTQDNINKSFIIRKGARNEQKEQEEEFNDFRLFYSRRQF